MTRIFGFDIGTTSIGFAVIDHDGSAGTGRILRLGVRVFPEARDPDGTPLNQQRRQKRMMRRQLRRRRQRRRGLNEALNAAGLLPAFGSPEWPVVMSLDPWDLRSRGLSDVLSAHEIGRAFYHLAQRRHFRGRDLEEIAGDAEAAMPEDDPGESAEDRQARSDRESTLQALKATGSTLGAWLAARGPHERKRGDHAHRTVVQQEFEALWTAQAKHHAILRDDDFKARIEDTIFAQRPVFWRKNTLGECAFMPGEALCPRGAWLSQQRRMLEKLNNLALEGGNARPLDEEERAAILAKLQTQSSMSWGGVRNALKALYKMRGDAGAEKSLKFNLETGGERKLLGNPVEAKLADILGDDWAAHPHKQAIRDALHARLWAADYGEVGEQRVVILPAADRRDRRVQAAKSFIDDFNVTPDQAAALCDFRFPAGWEPYSTRALQAFLPHLEKGVRFGVLVGGPEWEDWRNTTFPNRERPTGEVLDRLPSPAQREEREAISRIRNPTVVRTRNELRKVVNNLIGMFGKPDLIRIEVTRDVGRSKRDREEMLKANRKQERRRKEAASDLESKGISQPSRDTVEKWLLWRESQERCPYTGDQIGFDDLFREGRYDVEHIWPRWRSFDDSFANKTLCRRDLNAEKRNKMPFEAFGHRPAQWEAMRTRVAAMMATKGGAGMSRRKVRRFLAEAMPADFASRQLNDTGYAARQAVAFLRRLWPDVGDRAPVTVQSVTGRVTGQLRRLWGLNNILSENGEKTRTDHRHHAVDALVIACTHPGMIQRLSNYWQKSDDLRAERPVLQLPWSSIRADAERALAGIVVSHRVRKKISGPLHKETIYGDTKSEFATQSGIYRKFVTRKPVESLTRTELMAEPATDGAGIRDDTVRTILRDWIEERGGDPKKAFPPYPRLGANGPEIRKARLLTKQQLRLMAPVSTGYADPGANHHIAIYRLPDGNIDFEVVSLFEASRRLSRGEEIVRRNRGDGAEFVMSLAPGEAIRFPEGERCGIRIANSVWASGVVVTHLHADADGSTVWRPTAGSILSMGAQKISVDPIGRIRKAND